MYLYNIILFTYTETGHNSTRVHITYTFYVGILQIIIILRQLRTNQSNIIPNINKIILLIV